MNFKKITASSLLLAGIAISPHALAGASFDGSIIHVEAELWGGMGLGSFIAITSEEDILASDSTYPDKKDFPAHSSHADHSAWDIDFNQNVIEFTYTPIASPNLVYGYAYTESRVFHIIDRKDSLPDITNVIVDASLAPPGFNPDWVTFDVHSIYVNLKGSACNNGRASCTNPSSPTGYSNRIKLTVEFAGDEIIDDTPIEEKPVDSVAIDMTPIDDPSFNEPAIDNPTFNDPDIDEPAIDQPAIDTCPSTDEPINDPVIIDKEIIDGLSLWAESKFPQYFPSHQESTDIVWQYARFYPETGVYIGSLEGRIYAFKPKLGVFLDLGDLGDWADGADNKETLDELYLWVESTYPEFFPEYQESTDVVWQYARFYPETGVYIGSLEGRIYAFEPKLGTFFDLGNVSYWVEQMEKEINTK